MTLARTITYSDTRFMAHSGDCLVVTDDLWLTGPMPIPRTCNECGAEASELRSACIEERAMVFAMGHHARIKQRRKYTNEPYINHPEAVAELVRSVPHTEEQLAAAWCHDTVEDTGATLDDVRRELGDHVASLVEMLTDVSKPEDGNRAVRKALDLEHIAKASTEAKTIKLADLINNSESILDHDPDFARVYLEEKARLLEVLRDGDHTLHTMAVRIVAAGRAKLRAEGGRNG